MDFLDSNIIAYAFYSNDNSQKCQQIIKTGGITDTLNLIEAFYILEKITDKQTAEKAIKGILKSDIQIIDTDINLLFESLKRMNKYNLSIFDMVHYTCALLNKCSGIISYDSDFDNLEIQRIQP